MHPGAMGCGTECRSPSGKSSNGPVELGICGREGSPVSPLGVVMTAETRSSSALAQAFELDLHGASVRSWRLGSFESSHD
jgi:hypothetical protein